MTHYDIRPKDQQNSQIHKCMVYGFETGPTCFEIHTWNSYYEIATLAPGPQLVWPIVSVKLGLS